MHELQFADEDLLTPADLAASQSSEVQRGRMTAKSTTEATSMAPGKAECRSMTGYAMVRGEFKGWTVRLSVKSVNHRFLDVKLRIPDSLEPYEHRLRQAVRGRIHRGHLDVHVSMDPSEAAPVHVNRELLKAYVNAANDLQKQTGGKAELDTVSLLRLPGVITGLASALPETEEEQEELGKALETYLLEALGKMDEMRRNEGRHLTDELRARVAKISDRSRTSARAGEHAAAGVFAAIGSPAERIAERHQH